MTAFERARAVADAVLYEGFLLYPYTASAIKNQQRWQFGVVMPPAYADASEPSLMESHLLALPRGDAPQIEVVARFLQQCEGFDTKECDVALHAALRAGTTRLPFTRGPLSGTLVLDIVRDGAYVRVTVALRNESVSPQGATREETLPYAFISAHAIVHVADAVIVSLLDPFDDAKAAAAQCKNRRWFPVLIGAPDDDVRAAATALVSPIILYDFPEIAAHSPTPMFDATEIDELLLLSVASMSDREKREARATDARARAIVDRAESMDARLQERLHGRLTTGSRVVVHPKRNADAFDMFADGKTARVQAVHDDVDGRRYISVLFELDPASDLHEWYGRSYFYESDEVEPLPENAR